MELCYSVHQAVERVLGIVAVWHKIWLSSWKDCLPAILKVWLPSWIWSSRWSGAAHNASWFPLYFFLLLLSQSLFFHYYDLQMLAFFLIWLCFFIYYIVAYICVPSCFTRSAFLQSFPPSLFFLVFLNRGGGLFAS